MKMVDKIKEAYYLRQARKAAKKYNLDFERKCIFDFELYTQSYGYAKDGETSLIPMESGKTGIYKAKITKIYPGNTGQKDWKFEFQGYL